MRATGIRQRPAYNTRHTYATVMLMSGLNPSFVANQLGHSLPMLPPENQLVLLFDNFGEQTIGKIIKKAGAHIDDEFILWLITTLH